MKVTKQRSFIKSLSYRIFGTITSFAVVYVTTQKGSLATIIAFWDTLIKVVAYYCHERVWDRVNWGRVKP